MTPLPIALRALPVGEAATLAMLIDEEELFESRFYREFLSPYGMLDALSLDVALAVTLLGWCDDGEPLRKNEIRERLGHSRHVRQFRQARLACNSKRLQLAIPDIVQGITEIVEHQVNMTGKQIGHGRRQALVRHV